MTIPIPKITTQITHTHTHSYTTELYFLIDKANTMCDRQNENVPTIPASKSQSLWIDLWANGYVSEPMEMSMDLRICYFYM